MSFEEQEKLSAVRPQTVSCVYTTLYVETVNDMNKTSLEITQPTAAIDKLCSLGSQL